MDEINVGGKEWVSSETPLSRKDLSTIALREAWAKQLRDIMQANNIETLSNKLHHSAGWLTSLVQAQVIDLQAFEIYQRERLQAQAVAQARFVVDKDNS